MFGVKQVTLHTLSLLLAKILLIIINKRENGNRTILLIRQVQLETGS